MMNGTNNIINSHVITHIVRGKVMDTSLKSTTVTTYIFMTAFWSSDVTTGFRQILCYKNNDIRVFYSTDTSSNLKNTARDQQNFSLFLTRNKTNDTKNNNSIFNSICSINSLKSAYYQIKSNKLRLDNITEDWFSLTSKLHRCTAKKKRFIKKFIKYYIFTSITILKT